MPDVIIKNAISGEVGVLARNDLIAPDLQSFFQLGQDSLSVDQKKKLSQIDEWLSKQTDDLVQRQLILKDIRYKLGTPSLGSSHIDSIHKYIMLKQAASDNEQLAKAMEA